MYRFGWLLTALLMLFGCRADDSPIDRLDVDAVVIETGVSGRHTAIVSGYLLDTCTQIDRVEQQLDRESITLTLVLNQPDSIYCPKLFAPFDQTVPLNTDGLPPGEYTVTAGDKSATFSLP